MLKNRFSKIHTFLRHKIWNFFTEIPDAQSFLDVEAEVSGSEDEVEDYAGLDLDAYESDGFIVKDGEEEDKEEEPKQEKNKKKRSRAVLIETEDEDDEEVPKATAAKRKPSQARQGTSGGNSPKPSKGPLITGGRKDIPKIVDTINMVESMDRARKEVLKNIALLKTEKKKRSLQQFRDEDDVELNSDSQKEVIDGGALEEPTEDEKKKKKKKPYDNFELPQYVEDDLLTDASKFKVSSN